MRRSRKVHVIGVDGSLRDADGSLRLAPDPQGLPLWPAEWPAPAEALANPAPTWHVIIVTPDTTSTLSYLRHDDPQPSNYEDLKKLMGEVDAWLGDESAKQLFCYSDFDNRYSELASTTLNYSCVAMTSFDFLAVVRGTSDAGLGATRLCTDGIGVLPKGMPWPLEASIRGPQEQLIRAIADGGYAQTILDELASYLKGGYEQLSAQDSYFRHEFGPVAEIIVTSPSGLTQIFNEQGLVAA